MDRPEHPEHDRARPDPRRAEHVDPKAGVSDDPRVDPTPDERHSDPETLTESPAEKGSS